MPYVDYVTLWHNEKMARYHWIDREEGNYMIIPENFINFRIILSDYFTERTVRIVCKHNFPPKNLSSVQCSGRQFGRFFREGRSNVHA